MATILRLILLLPLAILTVVVAMANRGPVTLALDPTGGDLGLPTVSVPLFIALFAALIVGILIGGIASWFGQRKHRKAARASRREAESLKQETERLKQMLPSTPALPSANS